MPPPPDIRSVQLIVGLEVHVELATRTKMFSRAPNPAHAQSIRTATVKERRPPPSPTGEVSPKATEGGFPPAHKASLRGGTETPHPAPNTLIDPTVLGLPGSLPVPNRAAVEMAIAVGLALGCRIAPVTRWDRKHYFYPDLPKGYQISQYELPLCFDGAVDVPTLDDAGDPIPDAPTTRIGIIRAHLEEDAGKLLHEAPGGAPIDFSIVDLNRAGTPLLEVVTRPDFRNPDQAVAFARLLRDACRYLGVSDSIMQEGQIRFEPNINTAITLDDGRVVRTPIVEVKNLNSFRALRQVIEHELAEQPRRWARDGREHAPGMKTTRGWDAAKARTFIQREKEEAHDYRYFPDPDMGPVAIPDQWTRDIAAALPELPPARARRYIDGYALAPKDAAALARDRPLADLYDQAIDAAAAAGIDRPDAARRCANLLLQRGQALANERGRAVHQLGITPAQLAAVAALRHTDRIGSSAADQLLALLCEPAHAGADPAELARDHGLITHRDEAALAAWCDQTLRDHAAIAEQVRAGKAAALGRLIGEVMKLSSGQADPKAVRQMLIEKLGVAE